MEAKHGDDPDHLRGVFEKAESLRLKRNSMKLLFKKHLEFENAVGNVRGADQVRRKAEEYVRGLMGGPAEAEDDGAE